MSQVSNAGETATVVTFVDGLAWFEDGTSIPATVDQVRALPILLEALSTLRDAQLYNSDGYLWTSRRGKPDLGVSLAKARFIAGEALLKAQVPQHFSAASENLLLACKYALKWLKGEYALLDDKWVISKLVSAIAEAERND